MKEQLSALMDEAWAGEELGAVVARIKGDADLRRAWDAYHLIGDTLRGHAGSDVTARVSRRLAEEPTVLAPQRSRHAPRRAAWYAMSAGAGVAALALVTWTALPLMQPSPRVADGATANAPIVPVAASTPARAAEPKARVATAELEDYLLAHQPYSHTSAIQGVAPYARTVAEGNRNSGDGGSP